MIDDSVEGNTQAYGGIAAEVYQRAAAAYGVPSARNASCFQAEPHVYERVFTEWLASEGVRAIAGVTAAHARFTSSGALAALVLSDGTIVSASQFIDGTYEGDLLPLSRVPYNYGREASGEWEESLGGQGLCTDFARNAQKHFLVQAAVNPFIDPRASSGPLLPYVASSYTTWDNTSAGATADARVQAFNFRACLTASTDPARAVAIKEPHGYAASQYEVFAR